MSVVIVFFVQRLSFNRLDYSNPQVKPKTPFSFREIIISSLDFHFHK